MEDQVTTSTTEPTIVESANTSAENTASQVIETATPMDANVTYSSLAKEDYSPNMSVTQNLINKAVQTEHAINQETNAGKAMNSFLTQGYDYDKAEAGSYWVAGAINDNNTQMSFLQTLINEEMYDEMDLQKYYYDTNLATARAYAAQKGKETAYGFYRAAQERALAEGELTGWYMPAEGRYLLGQYTVAQNTLENPDATPEEISKANRVAKAAESWFSANQITTRGIKCLAMMNYEENVRHNNVMAALQKQANDIAGANAAASAAGNDLNLREFKFKVEEEEMDKAVNFSYLLGLDDDAEYIGHKQEDYPNAKYLRGYEDAKSMLKTDTEHFAMVNTYASPAYIKGILGDDYYDVHIRYKNDQSLAGHKADIEANKGITSESPGFSNTNKKTHKGNEVLYTVVGDKVAVGYFDDGVWVPITDKNATFSDDKSIKDFIENQFGQDSMSTKAIRSVTIDGEKYYFGRASTDKNKTSYTNMVNSNWKKIYVNNWDLGNWDKIDKKAKESETVKGTKDKDGNTVRNLTYHPDLMDEKNINEYAIFSAKDDKGDTQYYSFESDGELKKLKSPKIKEVGTVEEHLKAGDIIGTAVRDNDRVRVCKASWKVGYDKETNTTYMALPHSDGTVEYYSVKGTVYGNTSIWKIKATNLSAQDITDAGFIPLTKPDTNSSKAIKNEFTANSAKQETTKASGNSYASATPSVKLEKYNPEYAKASYNKYEIDTDGSPVLTTLNEKEREDLLKNKINKVVI